MVVPSSFTISQYGISSAPATRVPALSASKSQPLPFHTATLPVFCSHVLVPGLPVVCSMIK
jgi:hypothetical protein